MDNPAEFYSLTHPQKGIWYTEKLYPGTSIGNIAGTVKIKGEIDYSLLEKAVNLVIEKNDSLRLRIIEEDNGPKQYVSRYNYCRLDFFDFSSQGLEKLYEWDTCQTQTPFLKLNSDLFYFALVKMTENTGGVYIKIHHLIGDGWTMVLLTSEIMRYYTMLKNGTNINENNKPSYIEYILNEEAYINSEKFHKDKEFWNERYQTVPELTTLKPRKSNNISSKARRKTFVLPAKLSSKIREHCRENKTSIFALFLCALSIYINRITAKDDIVIGTPVLNRSNAREKNMLGMFISTVPIRIRIEEMDNIDFTTFAQSVSREWLSVLRHQRYHYDLLLKDVRERHKGVDKLYDIVLSYQNAKLMKGESSDDYEGRWHTNGYQTESMYIHINDREDDSNIIVDYDYISDLFYTKEIEFIHDHIIRLLWHALDNPSKEICRIEMISEKEKRKILYEFNNTKANYPKDKCIHELFEEQAQKTPDNIALVFKDKSLTYRELNEKSNQLARLLRHKGVKPDTIVGMMVPRSLEMIIGILGILKAGGCYLPIDPEYPKERIRYMLEDSGTAILLTERSLVENLGYEGQIIDIYEDMIFNADNTDLESVNKPQDLIYIIYTSGSTGNPKGVMIEHRNVVRLIFNDKFQFSFDNKDVWTMFHSYCFDFSVWEMYGALLNGAKLIIISKEDSRDTKQFLNILKQEKATILNQTPAAFYNLINEENRCPNKLLSLRYVIFGGEALQPIMLKAFNEKYPFTRLINMYGITETTVHVTFKEIGEEEIAKNISNVGKPIPTLKTYIVDKNLNLLPIGIPGELCVSGDGVGRGYLNKEQLTGQKFVPNPFVENEIMYRSGDLARLFSKGDIEYLGRIDNQVKIRGHRIELGEIESALIKYNNIQETVVIAKENQSGNKQLYAYYVSDKEFQINELRHFLSHYLPEYMIPAYFVRLEKMPLTGNGKIDRKNLPDPDGSLKLDVEYQAPQNKTQETLAEIWCQVLEIHKVGINDNFFHLGGDSLSATKVISKIGNNITFADLYSNPTIKMLSEKIIKSGSQEKRFLLKLTENSMETGNSIICFPYGGGNAIIYKDLSDSISKIQKDYSLYAVNLPGHDIESQDEFLPVEEIAKELLNEIKKNIKGNIILYGHCVGSALAIEVASLLEKENIEVKALFLGAIFPPLFVKLYGKFFDPWKLYSDKNIIQFLNKIGLPEFDLNNEYVDSIMKAFRHDVRSFYRFFYNYSLEHRKRLKIPIYSIIGDKDPMTRNYKYRYKNWHRYSESVKLFIIKGADHYFLKNNSDELADILLSYELRNKHTSISAIDGGYYGYQ